MGKLTRAAELYLEDYYILNEARMELERFLDDLLDGIYDAISNELVNLSEENYEWKIWKNKSTPGTIQLYLVMKSSNYEFLRHNKSDLYVQFRDIRHTTKLVVPKSVELSVFCARANKRLRQKFDQWSIEEFGAEILDVTYPAIDPENTDQTVEDVASRMLEYCLQILQIVERFRMS